MEERKSTRTAITIEELYQFFAERKVVAPCAGCGRVEYMPTVGADGEGMQGIGIPVIERDTRWENGAIFAASYVPMLALTCTNCGTPRYFVWAVVEAWKKAKAGNPV